MKNLPRLIILIALIAAGILALPQVCFAWSISGTVYGGDGVTGMPGATITLKDSKLTLITTATSDTLGDYIFSDLSNGDYRLYISHPLYEMESPLSIPEWWRPVEYKNRHVPIKIQDADVPNINFYRGCGIKGFTDIDSDPNPGVGFPNDLQTFSDDTINTEEGKLVRFKIWVHDQEFFYYYEPVTPLPSGGIFDRDRGEFLWVPNYESEGTYNLTFKVSEYDYKERNAVTGVEIANPYPLQETRSITINVADKIPGKFTIVPNRQSGPAPFHVMFNLENIPANAAQDAVKPFHLWWEFGDGGIAHWFSPGNIYSNQGTYAVKCKIVDDNFNVIPGAVAQTTITVEPEPQPLRTFYAAPDADGAGDGSFSKPWTIAQVLNNTKISLQPGDRVYLRGGNYDLSNIKNNETTLGYPKRLDGTAENPIWIMAYPGEQPRLINSPIKTLGVLGAYNIYDGLYVECPKSYYNTWVWSGAHHNTFRNCTFVKGVLWVHFTYNSWILIENNHFIDGMAYSKGNYSVIRNNYTYGGIPPGPDYDHYWGFGTKKGSRGIQCYNNYINGYIRLAGIQDYTKGYENYWIGESADSIVHNNIIVADYPGDSKFTVRGRFFKPSNAFRLAVINNTFVSSYNDTKYEYSLVQFISTRNSSESGQLIYLAGSYGTRTLNMDCKNVLFLNNIFKQTGNSLFYDIESFNQEGFKSNYNLFSGIPANSTRSVKWGDTYYTISGYQTLTGQDANSLIADPQLLDQVNEDYHLTSGSPAINKGIPLPVSTLDFDGNPRLAGEPVAIGAYEYIPGLTTYTISGRVIDKTGAGIEGVNITLTGKDRLGTKTNAFGFYQFNSLISGDYLIRPYFGQASFIPKEVSVTISNADVQLSNLILNWPPVLDAITTKVIGVGENLSFTVTASDQDGDTLTYSAENLPSGATFTGQSFIWTPVAGQEATYDKLLFRVSDIYNATDQQIVKIVVLTDLIHGTGDGLKGDYFNDGGADGAKLSGTPVLTRRDLTVDFYWTGAPDPSLPIDYFSVRWTGQLLAPTSGTFTISVTHDDGARLWLNNQKLTDNWKNQAAVIDSAIVTLEAGQKYPIVLEHYEAFSTTSIQLYWVSPATAGQRVIIPQEYLYSTGQPIDTEAPTVPTGLTANPVSSTQIDLSWSASTDNVGVAGYKIYRNSAFLISVSATSYQDKNLTANTNYTYQVSAFDTVGNESSKSNSVQATTRGISNQLPQVTVSSDRTGGTAPLTVQFNCTAQDPDGSIISYSWNFDDNSTSNQQNPVHTYNSGGAYTAVITVTDNLGAIASAYITITVTEALQNVFYLSPNGSDANPGTVAAPWQSFVYAWSQLKAGDTLKLMDGLHTITEETQMVGNPATANARITIESAQGANPLVKGSMNINDYTKLWITNYMTVKNITFIDNGHFPLLIRGNNVIVENNTFRNCLHFMFTDPVYNFVLRNNEFWFDNPQGASGIKTRALSGLIEHNTFHWTETGSAYGAIITWGQAKNIEIRYNKFIGIPNATNPYPDGECIWMGGYYTSIYGDQANNGEWESVNINAHDNIMINMPLAAVSFSHARDCSFYNNTYYNPNYTKWTVGIWGVLNDEYGNPTNRDPALYHNPKNITIKNNIFYAGYPGVDKHIFHVHPNCDEGLAVNNNVWYTDNPAEPKVFWTYSGLIPFSDYVIQSGQDTASVFSNPFLKDPANSDLHLLSASPAIDKGAALSTNWPDFDGIIRPQGAGVDIGAYEYIRPTQVLEGDFNNDGVVDIQDLILVAKDYGVKYNISHIILVAKNYGRTQ